MWSRLATHKQADTVMQLDCLTCALWLMCGLPVLNSSGTRTSSAAALAAAGGLAVLWDIQSCACSSVGASQSAKWSPCPVEQVNMQKAPMIPRHHANANKHCITAGEPSSMLTMAAGIVITRHHSIGKLVGKYCNGSMGSCCQHRTCK